MTGSERYLDAIERALTEEAIGPDNAITSAELADRITGEEEDANPTTRDLVRQLVADRQVLVIASNSGYYVPTDPEQVEDYVAGLEDRIAGIEDRIERVHTALVEHEWPEQPTENPTTLSADEIERIEDDPLLTVEDVKARRARTDGGESS